MSEGPRYQVIRSKAIAPTTAARMTLKPSVASGQPSQVDGSCPHGFGNGGAEDQERNEVPYGGPGHRKPGRENPCRHDRSDRVGRVVEAVDEVKRQSNKDDDYRFETEVEHQLCLREIVSIVFATSSKRSMPCSICSMISFHLRTSIAL